MFFNCEFESMVAESWCQKPYHCNTSPSNLVISNFSNFEYFSVTFLVETGVAPRIVDEDTAVSMLFNIHSILMRVSFISSVSSRQTYLMSLVFLIVWCNISLVNYLEDIIIESFYDVKVYYSCEPLTIKKVQ